VSKQYKYSNGPRLLSDYSPSLHSSEVETEALETLASCTMDVATKNELPIQRHSAVDIGLNRTEVVIIDAHSQLIRLTSSSSLLCQKC